MLKTYLLVLHIVLLLVIVKSDFIDRVERKLGIPAAELSSYYYNMVAFHTRQDKNLTHNAVLFIGDSHIQGLAVSSITPYAVNYGIAGDTTLGVINRLAFYKSITSANYIVLAIGFNDLKRRNQNDIIENITEIMDTIPSNKKLIICAIHPIDERVINDTINNQQINQLNDRIKKLTINYLNAEFVTITDAITVNGNLSPQYHIGDGVHLNKNGYDIWIQQLKK